MAADSRSRFVGALMSPLGALTAIASASNGRTSETLATRLSEQSLQSTIVVLAIIVSPVAFMTTNGDLAVASVWTLAALLLMLFRFGEPPVLAFAVMLQWISVVSPLFMANIHDEILGTSLALPALIDATWLGLASLLALGAGMRLGRGASRRWTLDELRTSGSSMAPIRLLLVYAATVGFAMVVVPVLSRMLPGLGQQILILGSLPVLIAFLVLWSATVSRSGRLLASVIVLLNVVLGFGGYFSSFKEILLLALIVISMNAVSIKRLLVNPIVILLTSVTLVLAGFWSNIKSDYRDFVNGGTGQQVVLVSREARVNFLRDQISRFKTSDLLDGLETTLRRIGYVEYFARAIETVPDRIPHQNGRLWGEAIQHVLLPRVLFPQKGSINDSDRTNEFTGIRVATAAQGASIGIGYVGESYIDFGPVGMMLPIFALGLAWGRGYRILSRTGGVPLLSVAAASIFILSGAHLFESSNIKIIGGSISLFLILYLLLRFGDEVLWAFLTGGGRTQSGEAPE